MTSYNDTDPATLEVTDASAASAGDWLTIASAEDPIAYQIESISGTTLTLTDEFDGDTDLTQPGDLATYLYDGASTVAQDLEPEYVAIDGTTAYVSLQENNAIAEVDFSDVSNPTVTDVYALGTKDHSIAGNGLDPSKEDGPGGDPEVNINTFPLQGLYQPDTITPVTIDGTTYLLTANEGDAREYDGFVGETSIDALQFDSALNTGLQNDAQLGDLATPITLGDTDDDGEVEELYAYGARSFSIWNPANFDGGTALVYDSGDFIEQETARAFPDHFNANNDENTLDDRSDNKGPEPEAVAVGEVNGSTYAFVGLERISGIMVFDISDPSNVDFLQYINNRDFSIDDIEGSVTGDGAVGDIGPESIVFIPAADNPNSSTDLLAVSNEVSGTVSLYTFATPPPPALLISEVADPGDQFEGRFVELYNGSDETIDLAAGDWHLSRQANGGNFGDIELTGTLAPGELYIVGRSAFEGFYGFAPDVESGFISGNGDDGYFLYQGGDSETGTLVDAYGVLDQDGSGQSWEYENSQVTRNAGVTEPSPTWTASEWTITAADVADMTPGNTPLPVELTAFTGTLDDAGILLEWQTASETNNAGFHIEHRAPTAEGFSQIAFRDGNGTTVEARSYAFRVGDVEPGTHRFRLRQVDTDGTQSLSETITVQATLQEAFRLSGAAPNPVRQTATLDLAVKKAQAVRVDLYNLLGQRVETLFDGTARPGAPTTLTVDGDRLSSGVYFVRVEGEQFQATRKVTVVR